MQHLVTRARVAQAVYEHFSQEEVDAVVRDFGKHVYDNARELARMAFDETGLGVYEDKVLKALGKSRVIWNNLKGKKSRGVIGEDVDSNLVLVAKPMGVVGAVCPVTNPVVTPMCNAMFALKAGNAVIFAPHPKAEESTWALTKSYRAILRAHGAPEDLVQMVRNGSVETTRALMRAVDVVVATGGGAMVKSAYSSGKPSYGVGAGNVPVIIDRDVDLQDACEKIVLGASFDNGIICSHEQFVFAPREQYQAVIDQFVATGRVWFTSDPEKVQKLRDVCFPGWPYEQGRRRQVAAGDRCDGGYRGARGYAHHPGPSQRSWFGRHSGTREAVPGGCDPSLRDVRRRGGHGQGQSAGRRRRALGGTALQQRGAYPHHGRGVADQPPGGQPGVGDHRGRVVDQWVCADHDVGLRLLGRQLDLGELDYKHLMNVSRIGKVIIGKHVPTDEEIWAA